MSEKPEFVTEGLTFTSEQVVKLAGLTPRKLAYWVDTGVVSASVDRAKGRGRVRLFTFTDLVEIKVAAWLRDLISLQLIRKVVDRLKTLHRLEAPLGAVRFGVVEFRSGDMVTGYDVVLQMPDGRWESASRDGQLVLELFIPVGELSEALGAGVHELRSRRDRVGKIERRRGVLGSTPVVAGTRVPTKAIWNLHRSGSTDEEIVDSYPGLDIADVTAAISAERRRRSVSA